jgi:UDP-glucose 4-epimerase
VKRILVTGGAGYIGSVLTELLAARGFQPVVLDNLAQGHLEAVSPGTPVAIADLQDRDALEDVFSKHGIEAVIHLAAVSVVGDSMGQPLRYYRENVIGLINLLIAMRVAGVNTLVFSSTAAVYGEPQQIPISEMCPMAPINPYGWTKLMCEQILADTGRAHGLCYASLRYFNVAGATQRCGEAHRPETHLIPRVLDVALGQQPHVEIYGTDYPTPDGTCIRDYIHVVDLAEAHLLALEAAKRASGIYNLGSSAGYSVREVIACAEKVTGRRIACVEKPRRIGDPPRLIAGHKKIQSELGWQPRRTLQDMVASAWAWRQRHPEGYVPSSKP